MFFLSNGNELNFRLHYIYKIIGIIFNLILIVKELDMFAMTSEAMETPPGAAISKPQISL